MTAPSRLADPQEHDDLLNYQLKLLVRLGGAPAIRLCEGRYGIARTEWRLVAALVETGPLSPMALAERSGIEPGRTSQTVAKLHTKGFVQREPDPGHPKRTLVAVTEAGRQLYADLWPQLAEINRRLVAALDDDEARVLETCLRKLTERARQVYEEGGGVDVRTDRRLGGSRRFWR
ncbi:MAG: MarR family transcriptional regulator [Caldimonas sp.]